MACMILSWHGKTAENQMPSYGRWFYGGFCCFCSCFVYHWHAVCYMNLQFFVVFAKRQKSCKLPAKQSVLPRRQVNLAPLTSLFYSPTLTISHCKTLKTTLRRAANATRNGISFTWKHDFPVFANVQESVRRRVRMIFHIGHTVGGGEGEEQQCVGTLLLTLPLLALILALSLWLLRSKLRRRRWQHTHASSWRFPFYLEKKQKRHRPCVVLLNEIQFLQSIHTKSTRIIMCFK